MVACEQKAPSKCAEAALGVVAKLSQPGDTNWTTVMKLGENIKHKSKSDSENFHDQWRPVSGRPPQNVLGIPSCGGQVRLGRGPPIGLQSRNLVRTSNTSLRVILRIFYE